jgi:tRNA pseudouridine38-40 synthase
MATWKLTVEYKGTRYQGWQEQAAGKTIQGEIRKAAEDFLGEKVDLGGSGRTDAGVHALAQVAHLRATRKKATGLLQQGLNERLPADIHVLRVENSPERFHARHSATGRFYLYQISRRRTAFSKDYVWWIKPPLNLEKMRECASRFIGRHDFVSFTERPVEQGSTLVEVTHFELAPAGDLILIRLGASHFLWRMVRRVVGVLAQVGLGEMTTREAEEFLKSYKQGVAQWTAPASGLFLEKVLYSGDLPPGPVRAAFPVTSD